MSPTKDDAKRNGQTKELPLPEEKLREMYRQMVLLRVFEEKTGQQYQMKKFSGFCHLYIGQEAVAVGSVAALELGKDYIFQTYRDHAHALLMGLTPRDVMAELFMKSTGCSKGKGGSMHMFNAKMRFMGGNGIVGGHVPLAAGVAFASKYRDEKAVTLCFLGDAAVNQGTFHESLNMAGLWGLPVVYIVENNIYGMGTAVNRSCAQPDLYKRTGDAYNIPGIRVNGMDVMEVYDAVKKAADLARNENRPTFLEMQTYRFRGHSMSDPAVTYRTKDEVSQWQQRDPIDRLREQFPDAFPKEFIAKVDEEIRDIVADSIKFAEESPFPDQSEIWTDVYADCEGYPGRDVSPSPFVYPYNDFGPGQIKK